MFRKSAVAIAIHWLSSISALAAPKFPFPQDQNYPNGIKPAGADHNDVQAAYNIFLKNYYEESGEAARIKWDVPAQTVSEGIGYGMIAMVYMDNATNNTQAKFDKLWNYYNRFLDPNGLMHWKVTGFSGAAEQNGATDGDIDVAFALCVAYFQWGDAKYKTAATAMLGKIYTHEVNGAKVLKPGDAFDNPKNPSYFVAAAIGLFSRIKFDNNDWGAVLAANYSHVASAQNATTGLVPDWTQDNGSPDARGSNYTFDASRVPWRMGLAYIWYGDAQAKSIANKMTSWLKTSTNGDPSQIASGYQLTGAKVGAFNLPTYIGPFACGAMVDASHQAWLDASYRKLASFIDDDNYYNECLQLLSLLTMTGNLLDFSTATPKTAFTISTGVSPANAGTVKLTPQKATYALNESVTMEAMPSGQNKFVSWGGDVTGAAVTQVITVKSDMKVTAYFNAGSADLLDDGEDGDHLTRLGTKWFTYADELNKGASKVIPKTSLTSDFKMTDGGAGETSKAAKISFTLDKGTNPYNPFVGLGFPLNPLGDSTPVNIVTSSGLTFYFKGASADVRVETLNIKDFGFFFIRLPASPTWTLVSFKWADFAQAIWAVKADFDLTKATKIAWQTINTGKTGDAGDIWVDEVHLPGYAVPVSISPGQRMLRSESRHGNLRDNGLRAWVPTYVLPSDSEKGRFDVRGKVQAAEGPLQPAR
ncbi:MAG: glycosyl hydrolase family 8 [Fibrobacteria bacterium]